MPLDQYDMSIEDGRPIYLYEFSLGALKWRYASCAADVQAAVNAIDPLVNWAACAISHDAVRETGEAAVDALTIEATVDIAPAQIYLTSPPQSPLMVRIYQKDASDPELYSMYSGEITTVTPYRLVTVALNARLGLSSRHAGP